MGLVLGLDVRNVKSHVAFQNRGFWGCRVRIQSRFHDTEPLPQNIDPLLVSLQVMGSVLGARDVLSQFCRFTVRFGVSFKMSDNLYRLLASVLSFGVSFGVRCEKC